MEPLSVFHEPGYLAHNKARLDHLASLGLPIDGRTVLELGAGIADHTQFFLDRGCKVTVTDGRPENVAEILKRYPKRTAKLFDVESESLDRFPPHEIVHCYGLLYHCFHWVSVLQKIAAFAPSLLLLETCVSAYDTFCKSEDSSDPRCSLRGFGSRPGRDELWLTLRDSFPFVYCPFTQPAHEEFPVDWDDPGSGECRSVFIASARELKNPLLSADLLVRQTRYVDPV